MFASFSASPKELQKAALHGESESSPDWRGLGLVRVQSRGFPDAIAEVVQGRPGTQAGRRLSADRDQFIRCAVIEVITLLYFYFGLSLLPTHIDRPIFRFLLLHREKLYGRSQKHGRVNHRRHSESAERRGALPAFEQQSAAKVHQRTQKLRGQDKRWFSIYCARYIVSFLTFYSLFLYSTFK